MAPEQASDPSFEELLAYIRDERGFDFTGYKRPSLRRRVEKRMQSLRIGEFGEYHRFLAANPGEFPALFDTILINVTGFFRDLPAWDFVRGEIVPRILDARADREVRIWSSGCSTGEEAYTLAIVFAEALGDDRFRQQVKIYATDVDDDALGEGRRALYTPHAVASVPVDLRDRYFERLGDRWVFRPDLRRNVIFGRHDLVQDPPISRVDLLSARNTLMYFQPQSQTRVLQNFHFALRDSGFLFLGKSEVLMTRTPLFEPFDLKRRVFTKADGTQAEPRRPAPAIDPPLAAAEIATDVLIRQAGFEAAPIAQVVIDREGRLELANVQARALFGLGQRDIGRQIQDLELSYRPIELRSRIEDAYEQRHTISVRDVEWRLPSDEVRFVDVQVVPLAVGGGEPIGVGITFTDVTRYRMLQHALEASKREVEAGYEDLQSMNEELETTNEELQSTNEELETTNEELQSTNEELETMNEELQSTNEELHAINDELNKRTEELNSANAFLESMFTGIGAGVAAVDRELSVIAWSAGASDLWGLRDDEAIGRNFLNLDVGLPVDKLRRPIKEALEGGRSDLELQAVNRRGREIACRVSCTPLLDKNGEPRGVIVFMEPVEPS